ncbi:MAG: DUF2190 family protein [Sinobacteraceae bacterium]|nr:DUF2190 family protein [Nevskiaceae bacterium]
MQNFVQTGETLTLTAPYAVSAGGGAKVGNIFGVAVDDVASGADGEFVVDDAVFDLTALSTDTFSVGDYVYWDDTNKRCTSTATGNSKIGVATAPKISGAATVRVRLNGISL